MADEDRVDLRHRALVAEVCLRLDSAQKYGFITGVPEVNVDACEAAIAAARDAGITYSEDDIEATFHLGLTP